jgi:hypothetical protein
MRKDALPKYVPMLSVLFLIAACTQTPFQIKKDSAEKVSLPDCGRNYSREMSFSDGWEYKTWVRYRDTDPRKAFEAAEASIEKMGYRVVRLDRASGNIIAEKVSGARPQAFYSMNVRVEKEDQALVVYLSIKAPRGTIDDSNLCSFYVEFEKGKSRAVAETLPRSVLVAPEKAKEPPQPTAPAAPTVSKSDSSPSPGSQPVPAVPPSQHPSPGPKGMVEVRWTVVNLREGPGMNFKVIGSITKGTPLSILEEKGNWIHVRTPEGKEPWVYKSATSEDGTKSQAPSSSAAPKVKPAKVASPM